MRVHSRPHKERDRCPCDLLPAPVTKMRVAPRSHALSIGVAKRMYHQRRSKTACVIHSTHRHMIASPILLNRGAAFCDQRSPTRVFFKVRNALTWTVLPSHLFHEKPQFLRSVTRVFRSISRKALLTVLAPGMSAPWERTIELFKLFIVFLVDERRAIAPCATMSSRDRKHADLCVDHLRQCTRTHKCAISSSDQIVYCSSDTPSR